MERFKKILPIARLLPIKRFMLNEHINGKLSGSYALEAYSVQDFSAWENQLFPLDAEDKRVLSNNIQNIAFCRNYIQNKPKR